jgi:hypothetical protein
MLSRFARLLLVATAFAPVLFTAAFVRSVQSRFDVRAQVYTALAIALTFACIAVIESAKRSLQIIPFTVETIRTADKEVFGFVIAYLLPLARLTPAPADLRITAFIYAILVFVVLTTHTYHFNPLLGLFGYHFYEVSTADKVTFIVITRRDMRRKALIERVVQLTDYIVLETP